MAKTDVRKKRKDKNKAKKKRLELKKLKEKNEAGEETTTTSNGSVETENSKKQKAVNYLKLWSEDKNQWKFNKTIQKYLLKNGLKQSMFSDEEFHIYCEYLKGLPEGSKNQLLTDAQKVLETEDSNEELMIIKNRAKNLIQSI